MISDSSSTSSSSSSLLVPIAICSAALVLLAMIIGAVIYRRSRRERGNQIYAMQRLERQLNQSQTEVQALRKAWVISPSDVDLKEPIGAGGFGRVFAGTWGDHKVAIKVILGELLMMDETITDEFEKEIRFMQQMRHANVVLFYGAGQQEDGTPFLVTELVERGSLYSVLMHHDGTIPWRRKLQFALDTAKGMAYLHDSNVIHRDLKSHNLLVSSQWRVKIADFGTSRLLDALNHQQQTQGEAQAHSVSVLMDSLSETAFNESNNSRSSSLSSGVATMTTQLGSPLWMSPELLLRQPYGPATDVYSFAIVLFEIIEQKLPWEEISGPIFAVLENEVPKGRRPKFERATPDDERYALQTLMTSCWAPKAAHRPTFSAILECPCFSLLCESDV